MHRGSRSYSGAPGRCIALGALLALASALPVRADALDAAQQVLSGAATSPVPQGWTLGAALYNGASPYRAGPTSSWLVPGGIYIGKQWMYLGDRVFYSVETRTGLSLFGRLRVRLANLDPADSVEWTGLEPRRAQLEAGVGAALISPVGIWGARISADASGRSKGSEGLMSWSAPLTGAGWLVLPSVGLIWRSSRLANYYFGGVSAAEAALGRPAYNVGATWSVAPSLVASYRIDANWLAGAVIGYESFARAVRHSPLVQKRGRHDALVGLGYVWR
jgi:MipA family protein